MEFDPKVHESRIKALIEEGDPQQLLSFLDSFAPLERVSSYRFTIRSISFEPWKNASLDLMITLADRIIDYCEIQGGDFIQQANVTCFNTSANLADCWGDEFVRHRRHFEKGKEYGERALAFRKLLQKGPAAEALAHWAIGKHALSLEDRTRALEEFRAAMSCEQAANPKATLDLGAPDTYLIATGYLALAEADPVAMTKLMDIFDQMRDTVQGKEDAEFIVSQLRNTARNINSPLLALLDGRD